MRADAEVSAALTLFMNGAGLLDMPDDDAAETVLGFEMELSAL